MKQLTPHVPPPHSPPPSSTPVPSLGSQLGSWLALLVLLGLTAGSAFIPMGMFNTVVNMIIAIAKALVVMVFFMKLRTDQPLIRIVAAVGFVWLALMIGLSLADQLTRVLLLPR